MAIMLDEMNVKTGRENKVHEEAIKREGCGEGN